MTRLAILADDLTGAADAGATFAAQGFATAITFQFQDETPKEVDIIIISAESRDTDPITATHLNRQAALSLSPGFASGNPRLVYKKIDSALRGFPREELLAVMEALGEKRALVAPALPTEGRTTVGGRQYIYGLPLEESQFGRDGVSSDVLALFAGDHGYPVTRLDIPTIRRGIDAVVFALRQIPTGIIVADAEREDDLRILANAALGSDLRLLSGSAGLAQQLSSMLAMKTSAAAAHSLPGSASAPEIPQRNGQRNGPVLVVAGSQHQATAAQVAALQQAGYPVVRLSQEHLDDRSRSITDPASDLVRHLMAGHSAILTTNGLGPSVHGPSFVGSRLAAIVAEAATHGHIGGLVLTGGDVAASILAALGARMIHLRGEVRPAMPWGLLESTSLPPLPVVTKAGSFGTDDALLACLAYLGVEPIGS